MGFNSAFKGLIFRDGELPLLHVCMFWLITFDTWEKEWELLLLNIMV